MSPAPRWHTEPPTTTPPSPSAPVSPDPQTPVDPQPRPDPRTPVDPPSPVYPGTGTPHDYPSEGDCGVTNISGCVAEAVDGVFRRLVTSALNPLLNLVSHTLLTTPDLTALPHVRQLWDSSWQLVLALYVLVVMGAGVLLMVRETLQTRWSWRELAPRLVIGFVAGALSMALATGAIRFANALAEALSGNGVDADSAAAALRQLTDSGPTGGIFMLLLGVALVVILVVLMVAYVVRIAITVMLVIAAPLALMCHALPGFESIARWWWRSFGACLAIQVVQSLVLVTSLRVFLTPGDWGFFGPNSQGMVDQIIAIALMGILVKTPFWLLSVLRIGQGRTLAGSIVRSYITYKTLGALKAAHNKPARTATTAKPVARRPPRPPDPYARVRATRDGQLMLPLEGVHRVKRQPDSAAGQPVSTPKPASSRGSRGKQLAFDFDLPATPDPYRGIRPGRGGQYPLPIPVTRVRPAPAPEPAAPPAKRTPSRGSRGKQLALDFDTPAAPDPYTRVRPLRGGQYPLPIPVNRVRPAPPGPSVPRPPVPVAKGSAGRQLHLPLPDLPVRRRAPRTPEGGLSS
ncbi:hypothetical protein J2W56_006672 [Nocardia kruczakiae]|uniref:TrbL/VirB6 plasmid conjugal transfer protein n=1 Tax=Nocardia kruczakiae TaxID=261477 RepID=A0ABU1XQV7_9NOCA|nr:hypothetical protein [Nocardia kruczakiae]MDR7172906.1 hypothetical protein [Nocardia kruczakiae]